MKKIKKIIVTAFALVLCAACCFGLTACTTDEIKQNTSAAMEASTNVLPVEYSAELATSILQSAFSELRTRSYTMSGNQKVYISGALISSAGGGNLTYINTKDRTEIYQTFSGGTGAKTMKGEDVIKKLTDTTTSTTKYYYIDTATTTVDGHETLKYYREVDTDNFPNTMNLETALSYVTGGMCYNGISYINCYNRFKTSSSDEFYTLAYYQIQIKDGLIIKIDYTARTETYMEVSNTISMNYNYDNIEAKDLPDTIQELQTLGYIEGNIHTAFSSL